MTKKPNWALLGTIAGVCAAPFTGGASLLATGGLGFVGGKIIETTGLFNSDSSDDNTSQIMKQWEMQNEQWKEMVKLNREEVERLRKEREDKEKKIKNNNDEVAKLNAIINNPHSSEEEKKNAKKRIVLLEDDNKKLKKELAKIAKDIENKSKVPPAPSKPWNFPKLGLLDKVLLASGAVLLIYLLIPESKKK